MAYNRFSRTGPIEAANNLNQALSAFGNMLQLKQQKEQQLQQQQLQNVLLGTVVNSKSYPEFNTNLGNAIKLGLPADAAFGAVKNVGEPLRNADMKFWTESERMKYDADKAAKEASTASKINTEQNTKNEQVPSIIQINDQGVAETIEPFQASGAPNPLYSQVQKSQKILQDFVDKNGKQMKSESVKKIFDVIKGSASPSALTKEDFVTTPEYRPDDPNNPNASMENFRQKNSVIQYENPVTGKTEGIKYDLAEKEYDSLLKIDWRKLTDEESNRLSALKKSLNNGSVTQSPTSDVLPMPKNKSDLIVNKIYMTPQGELKWNGSKFVGK